MDKKKILLISALVLGLAALPTLTIDPNSFVLDRIDSQLLVACLGAISAIVLRPMLKERQQRWRNRRVAKILDSRPTRPTQP
jgi:xanthine/uracil permease